MTCLQHCNTEIIASAAWQMSAVQRKSHDVVTAAVAKTLKGWTMSHHVQEHCAHTEGSFTLVASNRCNRDLRLQA